MLVLATETNIGTASWFELVPTGSILMWAGQLPPAGYLLCDGSSLSRSSYPALFSVLGTTYGSEDLLTFNLPDLRGRVSVGSGAGVGLTNRALGTIGGTETVTLGVGEMPSHAHTGTVDSSGAHVHTGDTSVNGLHAHTGSTSTNGNHSHTSNAVGGQGNYGLALADGTNTGDSTDSSLGELNIWTVPGALTINASGDHMHSLNVDSSGNHVHTLNVNSAGTHQHTFISAATGGSGSHANMQPFLVLNFIIKI